MIINTKKQTSLTLLKENALNAAFNVDFFVTQKLIKTKEVTPMSSQPKNSTIRFELETNNTILIINRFKKLINLSTIGSYLK